MTYDELFAQIRRKKSFLCVGLDPDVRKLPACLKEAQEPLFDFCRAIIDATAPYCVAYKPNTAFFESCGAAGWQALEKTVAYLRTHYPDVLTIAAAKRAGITTLLLPEENRKDIEEIKPDYIRGLTFHYVRTNDDVLQLALEPQAQQ